MVRPSPTSAAVVAAAAVAGLAGTASAQYTATYVPSATGLPKTSENGQSGTNKCGTDSSDTSQCQNFYINDITDWCVWGPPNGGAVAENERVEVAYCTKSGRGTRVIPPGTVNGAHFVKTRSYVQVTGTGDFTKIGITPNDAGGELDPHGADGNGNPVGGLVFHNGQQMHEWFSFMSATEFCTRACFDGNRATSLCRHTYDELGCGFNAPGNYAAGVFESCDGNDAKDIMYGYPGLGTFVQTDTENGVQVPSPHPAPASYNCQSTDANALQGAVTDFGSAPASSSSSSLSSSSSSSSSSSVPTSTSSTTSSSSMSSTSSSTPSATSQSPFMPGGYTFVSSSDSTATSFSTAIAANRDSASNGASRLAALAGDRAASFINGALALAAVVAVFAL